MNARMSRHSTLPAVATAVVIFAALTAAAVNASAQGIDPPLTGMIELASEPAGAEVFLGDSLLGRTPLRIMAEHADSIRLYYPSRLAWDVQRRVLPSDPLHADQGVVLVRFDARVRLRTLPHDARVFRGDSLLGTTPILVGRDAGPLRIEALGYAGTDWNPVHAERRDMLVVLDPLDMTMDSKVEFRGTGLRLPPVEVLLPAGIGLAAGMAAVIFKQKADGLYDDYLGTGDDSLLSQTKKYDIYAGISLALLQMGLGYVIYRILDE